MLDGEEVRLEQQSCTYDNVGGNEDDGKWRKKVQIVRQHEVITKTEVEEAKGHGIY